MNFFAGHFDTAQVKSIKKFDILLNLSQGGRGYLFEFGQLSITPFWLNQNMEPPPHCLIFYQISNFFTSLCYSMSKWPEKIKIWFENSHKTSESSKRYQMSGNISEKVHFWKLQFLIIRNPNKVKYISFWLFLDICTLDYPDQPRNLKFDSIWARKRGWGSQAQTHLD